jgi:hypothetical protein
MRWLLALTMLALSSATVATGASAGITPPPALTILVIGGQSNALGFQSFVIDPTTHKDVFTEKGRSPADRHVLFTFEESGVAGGTLPPVPLDSPQRLAGAPSPVFGPEIGLARYLYGSGYKHLLIVKVAISGSSLAVDWAPGSKNLSLLVARVQAAVEWARNTGWSPTIGGFYWMQGERDATDGAYAASYRANLLQFIVTIRRELPLKSTRPVVIGQIDLTDFIHYESTHHLCSRKVCRSEQKWNAEVMKAQASVAGKYVFLAKTSKLPRYEDFLHLTNAAELTLGKEFGSLSHTRI